MPWFTTLFGRDSLITSLQVLPFMPDVARETLRVLADWQATEDDPDRDMEPGKILHELRVGELARTGELPHRPYYGSIDATPLWLILLDETYRWTGDIEMVRSLWPNAIAALEWIDRYGDRDGDGFVEYERRTPQGLLNQGWKDSGDAIRHRDGTPADPPIALVEIQGYVVDAKRRMAHLAERLGDRPLAKHLLGRGRGAGDEAQRGLLDAGPRVLRDGPRSRQAPGRRRSARMPGTCSGAAIVPPDRVDAVVDRLHGPVDGLRLGHPHLRVRPAGLQPGRLPHRLGLAARQRHDRGRE